MAKNVDYRIRKIDKNLDYIISISPYLTTYYKAVRVCFFASSDGGRQWYCKYEFSDAGEYSFQQGHSNAWGTNFGNQIKLDKDVDCTDHNMRRINIGIDIGRILYCSTRV